MSESDVAFRTRIVQAAANHPMWSGTFISQVLIAEGAELDKYAKHVSLIRLESDGDIQGDSGEPLQGNQSGAEGDTKGRRPTSDNPDGPA